MEDFKEQYRSLLRIYKKAEDTLHTLGLDSYEGLDTAAINELRYAGHHILLSITTDDPEERRKQLNRALSHCERSIYDAYDAAVFFRLEQFQDFSETYKTVVVASIIPNYSELCLEFKRAKDYLSKLRAESESREEYYSEIEEKYEALVIASDTLEASRQELNKLLTKEEKSDKQMQIQPRATMQAALISAGTFALFSLIALLLNS